MNTQLTYEVWAPQETYGIQYWQCVATFFYFQECLDYVEYCCRDRGAAYVLRNLRLDGHSWQASPVRDVLEGGRL